MENEYSARGTGGRISLLSLSVMLPREDGTEPKGGFLKGGEPGEGTGLVRNIPHEKEWIVEMEIFKGDCWRWMAVRTGRIQYPCFNLVST